VQPDGLRAYVACTPDDYVAVIDLKTLEMIGKINTGKQPDGLAWAVRKQGVGRESQRQARWGMKRGRS
jgi:YVTN family beta-propeller protein